MSNPRSNKYFCSSMPLIFDICTSNMRQDVSDLDDDSKNDSADPNVRVSNPRDLTRPSVAAQIS
jgi:hypothetical protein